MIGPPNKFPHHRPQAPQHNFSFSLQHKCICKTKAYRSDKPRVPQLYVYVPPFNRPYLPLHPWARLTGSPDLPSSLVPFCSRCCPASAAIQNLQKVDPFADTGDDTSSSTGNYVHIRIQQRNGRKTLTTVQGVPAEYDQKRILKALKKVLLLPSLLPPHSPFPCICQEMAK
jgi:Translation initiation factor SUI1